MDATSDASSETGSGAVVAAAEREAPDPGAPEWFRRALNHRPEIDFVEVNGRNIELLTWGRRSKPGLLLLHGNMAHADWWRFIAPFFADDFRVAAPSFSGMGGSSHHAAYDVHIYAEEAMGAAARAGLFDLGARPAVVGHSAGGGVSLLAAGKYPAAFTQAIVIDSVILPPALAQAPLEVRPNRVYPTLEAGAARYRLVPEQPVLNRYIVDWLARQSLKKVPGGWAWKFDATLKGRFSARGAWDYLGDIDCPLTFLNGALSSMTTDDRVEITRREAPGSARFLRIPEAYHHVPVDQPLALVAAMSALLADPVSATKSARSALS